MRRVGHQRSVRVSRRGSPSSGTTIENAVAQAKQPKLSTHPPSPLSLSLSLQSRTPAQSHIQARMPVRARTIAHACIHACMPACLPNPHTHTVDQGRQTDSGAATNGKKCPQLLVGGLLYAELVAAGVAESSRGGRQSVCANSCRITPYTTSRRAHHPHGMLSAHIAPCMDACRICQHQQRDTWRLPYAIMLSKAIWSSALKGRPSRSSSAGRCCSSRAR